MIVSFPGNRFTGEIAPALGKLVESNTIRIIDLAFVGKDEDGAVAAFELSDIDEEVRRGLDALGLEATGLLGEEDLMDAAADLEPGSSAAMLLWEDIWAAELASALRGAGGELVAIGRIPHDVVMEPARDAVHAALHRDVLPEEQRVGMPLENGREGAVDRLRNGKRLLTRQRDTAGTFRDNRGGTRCERRQHLLRRAHLR